MLLVFTTLLVPVSALAQNSEQNGGGLLEPYRPNAYGLGIDGDAAGRPFVWQPSTRIRPCGPTEQCHAERLWAGYGHGSIRQASTAKLPTVSRILLTA